MTITRNASGISDLAVRELAQVVADAAAAVPFFKDLYEGIAPIACLSDFEHLPIIEPSHYTRLGNVTRAVKDVWKLIKPMAPFNLDSHGFPLTVLQDKGDQRALQERLEYLLGRLGVRLGETVAILASPPHMYAAADLAEVLISLRRSCQIVLLTEQVEGWSYDTVTHLDARTVFNFSQRDVDDIGMHPSVRQVVTFNAKKASQGSFEHYDVLHLDEIPLIAVREGDGEYRCAPGQFYVEYDAFGRVILTTLRQRFMPFIRYRTAFRSPVLQG